MFLFLLYFWKAAYTLPMFLLIFHENKDRISGKGMVNTGDRIGENVEFLCE